MARYPTAEPFLPPNRDLISLAREVEDCRGCDLWERATQAVFGAGPARPDVMLVGEQPGDREDVEGKPFVGPAGRLLDDALEQAGIEDRFADGGGAAYDFFYVYGPGAQWGDEPAATGAPVVVEADKLERALHPYLL